MASMFVVENGSTLTINGKGENDRTTIISNAGNKGADTGAIRVLENSKLIVNDVTFNENKSKNGGAVSVRGGSVQMKDCVVQNCSADEKGGGLFADEASTVTLTNCNFDSNSAYDGGGIANYGTLTVSDCAVKSNTVRGGGAGIFPSRRKSLYVHQARYRQEALYFKDICRRVVKRRLEVNRQERS